MTKYQIKRKPNGHKRQGMLDIPLNEEVIHKNKCWITVCLDAGLHPAETCELPLPLAIMSVLGTC